MISFTANDYPDSDFQIITQDEIILHVHRSILSAASDFFKDMLSIPQPKGDLGHHVTVPETAKIMRILLTLTYPRVFEPLPKINSFETFYELLRAATKYFLELATHRLANHLVSLAESRPENALRIFAIASAVEMEDLLSRISRHCLRRSVEDLFQRDATASTAPAPALGPVSTRGPITLAEQPEPQEWNGSEFSADEIEALPLPQELERVASVAASSPPRSPSSRLLPVQDAFLEPNRRLHNILSSASARDICRLMALYTWRMNQINAATDNVYWHYQSACRHCGQTNYWHRFIDAAKREFIASGPVSGKIFTTDFILSTMFDQNCKDCIKGLLVDQRHKLQGLKAQFDSLRDSI